MKPKLGIGGKSVGSEILPGTVYWFTGLSGAGKTTIGRLFFEKMRAGKPNVVFLDGDVLREIFGHTTAHGLEERRAIAGQYSRLCLMLARQGIDVVIATISMFAEVRQWNRDHISEYREIYLRVPLAVLKERDQKELYSRAEKGEIVNVMGVDLPVEEPEFPDLILENDGRKAPEVLAEEAFKTLHPM